MGVSEIHNFNFEANHVVTMSSRYITPCKLFNHINVFIFVRYFRFCQ